ncbi:MAG: hypothetical protein KF777_02625 [Planctomycetaceae bacterium]|nr:hypothetical protein [Planctomycetaceae bacterium]
MRTTRVRQGFGLLFGLAICLGLAGDLAYGIGFVLSETREQLKLDYTVEATDHGTDRVTVVFTLVDEGRLKPLDEVRLVIPAEKKNSDGSYWMDLTVALEMRPQPDGSRVGRIHLRRDWAARGEIHLDTHTLDGKLDPLTRLHHVIPLKETVTNAAKASRTSN